MLRFILYLRKKSGQLHLIIPSLHKAIKKNIDLPCLLILALQYLDCWWHVLLCVKKYYYPHPNI